MNLYCMHYAIFGFTACINMSNTILPLSFMLVHYIKVIIDSLANVEINKLTMNNSSATCINLS